MLQLFTGRWLEGDHRTGRVRDLTRPAQRGHRPHAVQSPDYPSDLQHKQVSLAIGLSRRLPAGLVHRTAVRRVEVIPEGTAHGQVLHDERVLHGQQELNLIQDLIPAHRQVLWQLRHSRLPSVCAYAIHTAPPDRLREAGQHRSFPEGLALLGSPHRWLGYPEPLVRRGGRGHAAARADQMQPGAEH